MAGTIFLYLFWPSFNSALAPAISQQRVVVNTAFAISASCIGAAAFARLNLGMLDMEIMLNATLAGGVIIGAASDIVVSPGVAIIIGGMGGIVSAAGFAYLTPYLRNHNFFHLHDTCGVLSLHGIPGVLGGLSGAVCAALADRSWANPTAAAIVFPETNKGRSFV
jgi:ammonium transporter Rh